MPASAYTVPLNLSSILSMIPGSRFLGGLRKGGSGFDSMSVSDPAPSPMETLAIQASMIATPLPKIYDGLQPPDVEQPPIPPVLSFPGPWEFFTSGYIVGLVIMAILLHRMQNVAIPSSRGTRRAYRTLFRRPTAWERIHATVLPLEMSRTTTRLILHIPSVYFLTKILVVWILLALQTCGISLTFVDEHHSLGGVQCLLGTLEKWAMKKDMAHVCWSTYSAVCGAFLSEAFIKALDGLGRNGFPLGSVNNLSPFHLISYAFLLHIYSSPVAHRFHPPNDLPSRPDKHVVITITIALLQLLMFHVLSISRRLISHRLIPTTLTSLLSLSHFHTTLYFRCFGTSTSVIPPIATSTATTTSQPHAYAAVNASYPLLNYVPNLLETLLLFTIFVTVSINAIAQLLVQGRIEQLFSGLGLLSNALPSDHDAYTGFFANLPYEEDFLIVLLRVGVASLEATGLRGWANEVAPVQRPRVSPRRLWSLRGRGAEVGFPLETVYGRVKMGRFNVSQIEYGSTPVASTTGDIHSYDDITTARRSSQPMLGVPRLQRGFNNDIRTVDLGNGDRSPFSGPWTRTIIAFWQFLVVLSGVLTGLVLVLLKKARVRPRDSGRELDGKTSCGVVEDKLETEDTRSKRIEAETYRKFLRGEEISDDDDEDDDDGRATPLSDGGETSEVDSEEEGGGDEAEAIGLFTDILRNGGSLSPASSSAVGQREMVLAHLLHGSAHPLTRRGWNALVRREPTDPMNGVPYGNGGQMFDERHERELERRDREQGLQDLCAICLLAKRDIICWPCRCMALCDGCRETLAVRTPTSKHRCPCCRQTVEGYSKVFIP